MNRIVLSAFGAATLAVLVPPASAERMVSRTVPVPGHETALQVCYAGTYGLCQDTVINGASSVTLTINGAYAGGRFDKLSTQSTNPADTTTYCRFDGFIIQYTGAAGYVDADVTGTGDADTEQVRAVNALLQPVPAGDAQQHPLKVCLPAT